MLAFVAHVSSRLAFVRPVSLRCLPARWGCPCGTTVMISVYDAERCKYVQAHSVRVSHEMRRRVHKPCDPRIGHTPFETIYEVTAILLWTVLPRS